MNGKPVHIDVERFDADPSMRCTPLGRIRVRDIGNGQWLVYTKRLSDGRERQLHVIRSTDQKASVWDALYGRAWFSRPDVIAQIQRANDLRERGHESVHRDHRKDTKRDLRRWIKRDGRDELGRLFDRARR